MGLGASGAAVRHGSGHRGGSAALAAAVALVALALGACGTEHVTTGEAGTAGGTVTDGATPGGTATGGTTADGRTSDGTATGGRTSDGTATGGRSTGPSPSVRSPYVEPGAGDGAPHYRENNGFRIPGDMSAAGAEDARREAGRIEPVFKRLWQQGTWDPASVRAAMLQLGYEEERFDARGNRLGGALRVEPMSPRYVDGRYVRPEGARVGLRVRDDACVTAFIQRSNYQVSVNGPYLDTGCFQPPTGH
ncbi:hypothetical protein ACIRD2_08880 [Streptomyces sp. NPDC093595]|uniref:hypothetical protein n=1 Tax=Streptomyces sp. NPDC093595 TaxID=3366045 RepID=UPI00382BFC09